MRGTTISLPSRIRPVEFDRPQKQFNTAQKSNVKPDMATYWYNSMLCKFLITNYAGTMIYLPGRIRPPQKQSNSTGTNYAWHNDLPTRSNSTGQKQFNTAQKSNVKPDMATYWYNSMLCKFLITNYAWHNDLLARSNSTGLKNSFNTAQKSNVEPAWLHTGTIVCCASF